MTLEKIVKLEKKKEIEIKVDIEKKDKVSKKQEKDKKTLIVKQPEVKSSSKDNIGVSFRWQKFPYPIFSNLKMNNKVSGILNFYIYETKDECVGTIALNSNNKGNWSLSCPDNKKRSGIFKKGLGASGSIKVENNVIIGTGYDTYKNEVKFVAK